jgi:hypothetical protein
MGIATFPLRIFAESAEDLKWWQWIVISLIVGAVLGYINSNAPDPPAGHVLEPLNFEERLIRPAIDDHGTKIPWISDIIVHPPRTVMLAGKTEMRQMVYFRCIVLPQEGGTGRIEACSMLAPYPYVPMPRVGPGRHPHYPGMSNYVGQKGDTIQSVITKLYGRYTPELRAAFINANYFIYSRVTSAAQFKISPNQTYYVPWDVKDGHSIADFLTEASKMSFNASFQYRWMEIPKFVYPVWMGGSFLIIGLIWPALLGMMVNQGLGRDRGRGFDLSRYKGTSAPPVAAASGPTAADQQRLIDLEQEMLASLKAQQADEPPPSAQAPEAPPQVVALSGQAAAPAKQPEQAPAEKSYQGEFYPVDRQGPRQDKKQ